MFWIAVPPPWAVMTIPDAPAYGMRPPPPADHIEDADDE
jgi:hypothetical protein